MNDIDCEENYFGDGDHVGADRQFKIRFHEEYDGYQEDNEGEHKQGEPLKFRMFKKKLKKPRQKPRRKIGKFGFFYLIVLKAQLLQALLSEDWKKCFKPVKYGGTIQGGPIQIRKRQRGHFDQQSTQNQTELFDVSVPRLTR